MRENENNEGKRAIYFESREALQHASGEGATSKSSHDAALLGSADHCYLCVPNKQV